MLVGVLISIMIAMVVGVNLIPSITGAINTVKYDANSAAITGLSGLLNVLAYVYVAVFASALRKWMAALQSNLHRIISRTRGTLEQATPNQASHNERACVETKRETPLWGGDIVRTLLGSKRTNSILLGAVASKISGHLTSNRHDKTLRTRWNLEQAIPNQAENESFRACVTTRGRASFGMVV